MLVPVPSDIKRSRFRYFRDVSYSPKKVSILGLEVNALDSVFHDDAADPYAVAVSVSDDEMPPSFSGTCVVGLGFAVVTGCLALTLLISWII